MYFVHESHVCVVELLAGDTVGVATVVRSQIDHYQVGCPSRSWIPWHRAIAVGCIRAGSHVWNLEPLVCHATRGASIAFLIHQTDTRIGLMVSMLLPKGRLHTDCDRVFNIAKSSGEIERPGSEPFVCGILAGCQPVASELRRSESRSETYESPIIYTVLLNSGGFTNCASLWTKIPPICTV